MVNGDADGCGADIWLKGGLITREHRERMGEAVWLYLYLQQRVRFDGEHAGEFWVPDGTPYRHADAARVLFGTTADGQPAAMRTVKRWMAQLEAAHYVETRRLPYGLAVRITKYDAPRIRALRRKERSATDGPSDLTEQREVPKVAHPEVPQPVQRSAKSGTREVPQPVQRSATDGPSLYKDARGSNGTRDSRETNVGGADAPAPSVVRGNVNVQAAIDALRSEGMTGVLTPRDRAALKTTAADLGEMARLYAAIYRGEYGDDFMHDNLSVCLCLEKLPGWQSHLAGHQPPAKHASGTPKSASGRMRALIERTANGQPRSSLDAGGWGDPGPSLPEVRRRLPSQLP